MISTKRQFEEFVRSSVWRDIKDLLLLRRSEIRDKLEVGVSEDVDVFIEVRESARLRGRAEELKFLIDLPDEIVANYENFSEEDGNGK